MTEYERVTATEQPGWADWRWQQTHSLRSVAELVRVFPDLPPQLLDNISRYERSRRLSLTPYVLGLIGVSAGSRCPNLEDPIWRQVVPFWDEEVSTVNAFDGTTQNWETPTDMVTPITQHKYDNRVLVRLSNTCHSYCQFCYEALRTLAKDSDSRSFSEDLWRHTLRYLENHPDVQEIILSGGEPLIYDDARLESILRDIRAFSGSIQIRVHSRSLTFNPFRITRELCTLFKRFDVGVLGLHLAHPREVSESFIDAVHRLRDVVPILFANVPLLRGINNDIATLRDLFWKLYRHGVSAGYLYHFMPFSPGVSKFRTSVGEGIEIMKQMKRHVSNLAVPEFVVAHETGKYTVPLVEQSAPVIVINDGRRILRYINWKGELVEYFDE